MTPRPVLQLISLSTLRGRVFLGLALLLSVVGLGLHTYLPNREIRYAAAEKAEAAQATATILAYNLMPGVLFGDPEAIASIVDGTRHIDDISYLLVEDSVGNRLGGFIVAGVDPAGYQTESSELLVTDALFKMHRPIVHEGRLLGHVYIGYSTGEVRAQIYAMRMRLGLTIVVAFSVILAGTLFLCTRLTDPLSQIVDAAEAISAGDLSRRSGIRSRDEVGRLSATFDSMVERLQRAQDDLQSLNRSLEDRVADRTQELRVALAEASASERIARESEQRFRTIFDSSAIGIALIDPAKCLAQGNRAAETMWQMSAADLLGTPVERLLDPEAAPEVMVTLGEVLAGRLEVADAEIPFKRADGSQAWARVVTSPMRATDGSIQFAVAMIQDVTEQRSLADRLREAQKLDAVGRLAGGIAHDFNNLLTVINSMSELVLLELDDDDPNRADLKQIQNAGQRAAELTRQLLAFSRRQALNPRPMDVNEAIGEMGALLQRLIGADVNLTLSLPNGLPQVKADPSQLGQVIMNLAVNARDAMPRGGHLLIETAEMELDADSAALYDTTPGRVVQIAVTDTGVGMATETLSHVFEPFFTTKDLGRGTGLGLATVYGIVKQTGGGIRVKSEPGRGTTFLIVLPISRDLSLAAPSSERSVAGGNEHILIVEDDDAVRSVTKRILLRHGYRVTECENALEALNFVTHRPTQFHAVVTDVIMPQMSGPELAQHLAAIAPALPVLFISGHPREELANHGIDESSDRFLQKPMTPDQLATAVRRMLDDARGIVAA